MCAQMCVPSAKCVRLGTFCVCPPKMCVPKIGRDAKCVCLVNGLILSKYARYLLTSRLMRSFHTLFHMHHYIQSVFMEVMVSKAHDTGRLILLE